MKSIYLAVFLFAGSLAAQAQTTPTSATQNGTNAAPLPQPNVPGINLGPPTNQNPVVTQSPVNQATIDIKDKAETDKKVEQAVTGTGPIQTNRNTNNRPASRASGMKPRTEATRSTNARPAKQPSNSAIMTQPTTPPRP